MVDEFAKLLNDTKGDVMVGTHSWGEQLYNCINLEEGSTKTDYILHILSFYWKVMLALIPPTNYLGGWLAFFVALAFIGIMTAIVGDLAGMFGCVIGLEKSVTAITLVALGTSLPDTFASKVAAV
mmetsp:Transcript_23421/g.3845  ORF Transcript_23421/g.3845 Transcript_23421/m.3845 type:complete len:125 (-) Transcript_23421:361-735(-)